jgi:ATP-dependent helicase/nuclease subunit A
MIKREAEAAGDVVRMMTVHGAKGLQAPIVILPDTTSLPDARQNLFWLPVPQQPGVSVPVFCPRSALRPGAVAAAAAAAQAAQAEEYNRLLYVALTRAEDELIICGAEGKKALPDTSWYARVKAGFENLPGVCELDGKWQLDCPQTDPADRGSTHATAPVVTMPAWAGAAPDWVMLPPAREGTRPERLAPSRSAQDDSKRAIAASPLAAGMAALRGARAAAMAKGSAVHALLQHLPDLAGPAREAAARHFLSRIAELHDKTEAVWGQVQAVLAHPELVELFGPGSRAEVPLAGIIGDVEIGGLVDRLTVTATRVLIADYKTDRNPPDRADDIPERYLRQLGAYRRILAEIYPSREIQAALIWTETALVMPVPHALLSRHAPA